MKKIIVSVIGVFIVGLLFIGTIGLHVENKRVINNETQEFNTFLTNFLQACQKFSLGEKGEVKVIADYKGAHGESLPHEFQYSFLNLNTELLFESEAGYTMLFADQEILYFLTKEYRVPKEAFKIKNEVRKNTYELDVENFNKEMNTEYQKGEISFSIEGKLRKKIKKITVTLDDIIYTWEDDKLTINQKGNETLILKNSNGYSLSYNNDAKINLFANTEVRADIVMKQYSYSFEKVGQEIRVTMNTPASIYNRLELIFIAKEVEIKKEKVEDDKANPIYRYFDEIKGE